jgi:hypothetical protein
MTYSKPEMVWMGTAVHVIESSLTKGPMPIDSSLGPEFQTVSAAYEADE